jgi:hypothetical protein
VVSHTVPYWYPGPFKTFIPPWKKGGDKILGNMVVFLLTFIYKKDVL